MTFPSSILIARLKKSEGFSATPYLCPVGRVTIGYGWNLEANPEPLAPYGQVLVARIRRGSLKGDKLQAGLEQLGVSWTEAEAEEWLVEMVHQIMVQLVSSVPVFADLVANQDSPSLARAEVLVDMAYNMGVHGLLQFKKMLAAMANGNYRQASVEMLASVWAAQVKTRSRDLARVMREGVQL